MRNTFNMTTEENKYRKVLNLLRNSEPALKDPGEITEKVMSRLLEEKSRVSFPELITGYLFGWVYIGWVRRSMVTAALLIALIFVYQQALILKRISALSVRRIQNGTLIMTDLKDDLSNKMMLFRLSGKKLPDNNDKISEKDIDELINSLNKLQVKYKDLIYVIENDPRLKKYIETRMKETEKVKSNI
ncbi:MAG: hypothetical protein C0408_10600 [Odoribacter sp.]|nr:hypothetical protein [Odoribacter sp.]